MTDFLDHKVPYHINTWGKKETKQKTNHQQKTPKRTVVLPIKDTCNQFKSIYESSIISLCILIVVRSGEPHIKETKSNY